MATKGAYQGTFSKRLSGAPPGLLSFVPLSQQKDFYQYLEIQYLYWKKREIVWHTESDDPSPTQKNSILSIPFPKPVSLSRASLKPYYHL